MHPICDHDTSHACSVRTEDVICMRPCPKLLAGCFHKCQNRCGMACTAKCTIMVDKKLACGHSARMICATDPSKHECSVPCDDILPVCNHLCQGTCGGCRQGEQHIPCQEACERMLPCGHSCSALCHNVCPPCTQPCQKRCSHSRCPLMCGYPCIPCMEPCDRRCSHVRCDLLCHQVCQVACCDNPCTDVLRCGHQCMGLCGEPCPDICFVCKRPEDFRDIFSQITVHEFDGDERMIQLLDCGHIFEVEGLDTWMRMEESGGTESVQPKLCPQCRTPVLRSRRYANDVKQKRMQIEEVKKYILAQDKTNEGIRLLQQKEFVKAIEKFVSAIEENVANYETYYGLGCALCSVSMFECGAHLLRTIAMKWWHGREMRTVPDSAAATPSKMASEIRSSSNLFKSGGEATATPSTTRALDEKLASIIGGSQLHVKGEEAVREGLAMKAMVQWASALTNLGRHKDADAVCMKVLAKDGRNRGAADVLERARKGEKVRMEVVAAMMKEVGGRGHWYQCPNGHYYVVGECGGPMQTSICPDCQATVGGTNHAPADGNVHSSIDGSTHAAYGNHVGLGNFL